MGENDGGVLLDVKLSPDDADKEFAKLSQKATHLEEKLSRSKDVLKAAVNEAARLGAQLDAAKAKQSEMESSGTATTEQLKFQAETVASLQAQYNAADKRAERMAQSVEKVNADLTATREKAAKIAQELGKGGAALNQMGSFTDKLEKRLGRLAARVLIFSVFTSALRSLRSWFADVIKTDKDAVAAIAQLKGALLTLVQPLVGVVIPAFTAFVQVLAQVVGALASVVSSIMGTTVEQSAEAAENLNDEKKALDGVGASAKKAGKSLASFDEINKLGGDTAGAGGASASSEIAPDFSFLDGASERLQEIAKWVLLIGAGFALWEIGGKLGGALGGILQKLGLVAIAVGGLVLLWTGLKDAWENGVDWVNMAMMVGGLAAAVFALYQLLGPTAAAIAAVVGGLALFAVSMKDAFENGVSWPNAIGMVLGLAAAVAGLYILFGPVAAGIALVVGGIAMLVVAFHDIVENGFTVENTLLAIAGLLATGLGFFFITGSVIPLVIAAIAALLLAITVATGHGEELIGGIQTIIQGFLDFFTGIFTGDMEMAMGGIEKIFEGLQTVVSTVIESVKDFFLGFLDWLDEKTGGKFHDIIQFAKDIVSGFFDQIGAMADGFIEVLHGVVEFIRGVFTMDFDLAWKGIQDIFKGAVNTILGFWVGGMNLMIKAMNFVIDKLNGLSFTLPDWVPGFGGEKFGVSLPRIQEYQIPKLAAGAVIPPNREFMAVLGDQSNGTNLEAPEELIRQIVREESGGNYFSILQQILDAIKDGKVMMVDEAIFARVIHDTETSEDNRQGVPLVTVR